MARNEMNIHKLKAIVLTLILMATFALFPTTVSATVDSIWSGQFTIQVNDDTFEAWGYSSDMAVLHLSLPDMAYMLRGTSAQFNIQHPASESHQFWVVRGANYTPTGGELQEIPERFVTRSDNGFLFGWEGEDSSFLSYPEQTIVIGIDGEDYPETFFAIRTITDIDNTFFLVSDLAYILGFESITTTDRWHWGRYHENFVEGIEGIFLTDTHEAPVLPLQDASLLHLLIRINGYFPGHWVCKTYFVSGEINESVVWPAEIILSNDSIGFPYRYSVAPGRPQWTEAIELQQNSFQPLSMRVRADGMAVLYVDDPQSRFADYLIVVDPHLDYHNTIRLYIRGNPHIMVWYRIGWTGLPDRYIVAPTEDGGIRLSYVLNRWAFHGHEEMDFMIFRAIEAIEFGRFSDPLNDERLTLLHRQIGIDLSDPIIFEFVDNTVEHGYVYYYSLWRAIGDRFENMTPINHPPIGSIRVDVNYLFGLPAVDETKLASVEDGVNTTIVPPAHMAETGVVMNSVSSAPPYLEEPEQLSAPTNHFIWLIVFLIMLAVLLTLVLCRRFMRKKK